MTEETRLTLPELVERDEIQMETILLGSRKPYTKYETHVHLCVLSNPGLVPAADQVGDKDSSFWGPLRLANEDCDGYTGATITIEYGSSVNEARDHVKPTVVAAMREIIRLAQDVEEYGEDFLGWASRFSTGTEETTFARLEDDRYWFRYSHVLTAQLRRFLGAAFDEYMASDPDEDED